VVPAFTVSVAGVKLKLSIEIALAGPSAAQAPRLPRAPSRKQRRTRKKQRSDVTFLLSLDSQPRVNDRLRLPRARLDQCRNYSGFHHFLIKISFGVIAAHGTRQIHIIPANRRSPLNFQITIREYDLGNQPGINRPSLRS
jgi:hypothetical protein